LIKEGNNRGGEESGDFYKFQHVVFFTYQSPLGPLTIAITDGKVSSVVFGLKQCHPCECEDLLAMETNEVSKTALTKRIQKQLDGYFAGRLKTFALPLQYKGTPFQIKVWNYLRTIPYGKTVSYQTIAKAIGHPKSARAVGTACKHNPILIIIPCHRVVKSSGEVGEYAGGKKWKEQLLRLERI
jgi:O-6-methylguanine DNA methyltransferase